MASRVEELKRERLGEVAGMLAADPMSGPFATTLYADVAAEDLVEYDAPTLARLAEEGLAFLSANAGARIDLGEPSALDLKGRRHAVLRITAANRPFTFDSVLGELQASGAVVRLVAHPVLSVTRDPGGRATAVAPAPPDGIGSFSRQSFIHIHVEPIRDAEARSALLARLTTLLADVMKVTEEWPAMRLRVRRAVADVEVEHQGLPDASVDETASFLEWLADGHFVMLGTRDLTYASLDEFGLASPAMTGLGLMRDPTFKVLGRGTDFVTITPAMRAFLVSSEPLIVTKANVRSRIHRRDYLDYVAVKRFEEGRVVGELRIVGLFTSEAFTSPVRDIPLIRRKVEAILARAGLDPAGHSGKALTSVLEHYPRTELFQATTDELFEAAMAVVALEERPRVRVLVRRDPFDRFVSVLVFVPRDAYTSDLREAVGAMLAGRFDGRMSTYIPDFSTEGLVRVQFIIGRNAGEGPSPEQGELEAALRALLRRFEDALGDALEAGGDPERADRLAARYDGAFGADYQSAFDAAAAVADIEAIEALQGDAVDAWFSAADEGGTVQLKFYHPGEPVPLSRRVPLLEHLGFTAVDERTFRIARRGSPPVFLHDMTLTAPAGPDEAARERLREAVLAVWSGRAESDGFNALVLAAGLTWRQAAVLRTVGRYIRQTAMPFSIEYLWGALCRYPQIARLLSDRFAARLDPARATSVEPDGLPDAMFDTVVSLDDDTILRGFGQVIDATVRTNAFAPDGEGGAVTLKLAPGDLAFVPQPRPYREIFTHSPEVEGVHLRFGPVARGGLRWSDRPQDFRTEVLGLVKAQIVKNAVIVPTGSKGGFVPASPPPGADRAAVAQAGRAAYVAFITRLLAVTDDIDGDAVVPPPQVLRRDGDDPYLVVAADKGTATFSDTANGIALERGFWLGDAFASGGSAGYDHKAMGITARGAWEAVKRHFREMDVDIGTTPFTVAGVGDMSGDVFGNGMLLSPAIRLVAAFDHRHIFIDPDPDPAASLAERQRLFDLPRSSWADYNGELLSRGGGVFPRSAKEVPLSPEARALFGLGRGDLRPAAVLSAILRAPVDLLWFGGIGTYVRGPNESNADVGDKANDLLRIPADAVRAKVVGEGANLGMTQRARIAYGLAGGRCNSDAVDNSAGVNTSDVEVNVKIALEPARRDGRLPDAERLELLRVMTPDVAQLVLRNNYNQTLAISLEERRGAAALPQQMRLADELERRGLLDRAVEAFPATAELEARHAAGVGLTRPEIAVLVAFAKIAVRADLVAGAAPDDPALAGELQLYFPAAMRERFAVEIAGHRLRREIVATRVANLMVDRCGPTFAVAARDGAGIDVALLARGFMTALAGFDIRSLLLSIDALDSHIPGAVQLGLHARACAFLRETAQRIARSPAGLDVAALAGLVGEAGGAPESDAAAMYGLVEAGAPADLARRLAGLPALSRALSAAELARVSGRSLADSTAALLAAGDRFCLDRLEAAADAAPAADYYEWLALRKARDGLKRAELDLAAALLVGSGAPDAAAWAGMDAVQAGIGRIAQMLGDPRPSVARVTVAAGLLADLARQAVQLTESR